MKEQMIYDKNTIDQVIDFIEKRRSQNRDRHIVCIAGGSATGKSSLVSRGVTRELNNRNIPTTIIAQDDFQKGKDFVDDSSSPYRWDNPENFSFQESQLFLATLLSEGLANQPTFSLKDATRMDETKPVSLTPGELIIFEGLYAFRGAPEDEVLAKIYVKSPMYARTIRRVLRFLHDLKVNKPQTAIKQVVTSVQKAHIDHVSPQENEADIVIEVPYDWEKPQALFATEIANEKYEVVQGDAIWTTEPEAGLVLALHQYSDLLVFTIMDHETILFQAQVEPTIATAIQETDWLRS